MNFVRKNKALLILLIFASVCLFFSIGHYSNLYIDIGREMYYPMEILNGKVLYKTLFCIYGPFSYLFNALIYKIFGAKLASLYAIGALCALLITGFTYKIARKFLNGFEAFSLTFFVVVAGCLSTRIFNFTLPYAYAMVFGLVSFLISLYFLICYIENKKRAMLMVAAIFAGLALSNKYEFVLYLIPLFIAAGKEKALRTAIKWVLIPFLIPFLALFFQGVSTADLFSAFENIKNFSNTKALSAFYVTQGVYYTNRIWKVWAHNFICTLIPLAVIACGVWLFKFKNKIFGALIVFSGGLVVFMNADYSSYLWAVFLTLILFIFLFKKNSYAENIFILSALLISLKSLWGLSHANYGLYFAGVIFLALLILVKNKILRFALSILLFFASLSYFVCEFYLIGTNNTTVATDKGFLKTSSETGAATNALIDFVNNLEEDTPYVMIFPEGLSVNFLAGKKTYTTGKYNSLIPLYVEGLNEDKIVKFYEQNPPEYLVMSSANNPDYSEGAICDSYAEKFCKFVFQNYYPFDRIETDNIVFYIFKLE